MVGNFTMINFSYKWIESIKFLLLSLFNFFSIIGIIDMGFFTNKYFTGKYIKYFLLTSVVRPHSKTITTLLHMHEC